MNFVERSVGTVVPRHAWPTDMREQADLVDRFELLLPKLFNQHLRPEELNIEAVHMAWIEAGGDTTAANRTLFREVYGKDHVLIADLTDPVPEPGDVLHNVPVYMLNKTVRLMDICVYRVWDSEGQPSHRVAAERHYDEDPDTLEQRLDELEAFNKGRARLLKADDHIPPDVRPYDPIPNATVTLADGSVRTMDVRVVHARGRGEQRLVLAEHCACHQCHTQLCDNCQGCSPRDAACEYSCRCPTRT